MAVKKKSEKKSDSKKRSSKSVSKDLAIHFMPYSEIAHEDSINRIKKIMNIVLDRRIIILQGRLTSEEEVKLIENSMMLIGNIKGFQGVEIATISGDSEDRKLFDRIRYNIARILVGEQDALTIIGPASIVKEITRDPKKIELMLQRK
jgi:hypothetical protein